LDVAKAYLKGICHEGPKPDKLVIQLGVDLGTFKTVTINIANMQTSM
jgi:hypothetical protein